MATFDYTETAAQNALIDQVEGWADKVTATNQSIGINRTATYEVYLQDAMRQVLQAVPHDAVKEASADGSSQAATNPGSEYTRVPEPADLLIFMNLELAEWDRPVLETVDPRSDQHRLQYNSFTQADARNPIVVSMADAAAASGKELRCFPQDSTPTLSGFNYIPETAPENVPDALQPAMRAMAASFVLVADKEEGSELMWSVAQRLIQGIRRGQKMMIQQAFEEVRQSQEG